MFSFILILTYLIIPAQPAEDFTSIGAEEVIVDMARQAIQDNYELQEFRFQITPRWIPGSLRELSPQNIKSVKPRGPVQKYTNFEVVHQERGGWQTTEVQLKVEAQQRVPVLTQRKISGAVIEAGDLNWKWVAVDLGRDSPVADPQKLEGKTLRRTLNAGQYIGRDYISTSYMVEAGENVGMIYRQNGLQIVLECESRQDGAQGDEIQIYCKETRKKYTGKITGPGEVEWLKTQ